MGFKDLPFKIIIWLTVIGGIVASLLVGLIMSIAMKNWSNFMYIATYTFLIFTPIILVLTILALWVKEETK